MNRTTADRPIYFLLFLVFIYLICFNQLDSFCMRNYDESRVAKSSYEMSKTGELIIVKWNNTPDLWSTKPPLLNWIQALFIKIGGLGPVSARLPSAIAGAVLLLFLYYFFKKHYSDILLAYLISIILGTTGAFIWYDHSFRSADYDGLLTLFLTLGCLLFFSYLNTERSTKQIYLSFLFFSCAVLTKGPAGFFMFPGLFLYVIISGNFLALIK
ncbi:MAG: ArnT family glycosyltransferase, partial [Bacteroidia bacterium]